MILPNHQQQHILFHTYYMLFNQKRENSAFYKGHWVKGRSICVRQPLVPRNTNTTKRTSSLQVQTLKTYPFVAYYIFLLNDIVLLLFYSPITDSVILLVTIKKISMHVIHRKKHYLFNRDISQSPSETYIKVI